MKIWGSALLALLLAVGLCTPAAAEPALAEVTFYVR